MLPSEQRLRDNRHFRRVYAKGHSQTHRLLVLYHWQRRGEAQHEAPGRRIGFVVSKKLGKAVQRNRVKRRLREALRHLLPQMQEGSYDLIFVGRKGVQEAETEEIEQAVQTLLQSARRLSTQKEAP